MSGGRFSYMDATLKDEIFQWADKPTNVFEDREISALVWDVFDLIHAYDWYASGDTGEENYRAEVAAFKKKWFSNHEATKKKIIDDAIDDLQQDLYKTFGVT